MVAALVGAPASAQVASPFTSVTFFGDSFVDAGAFAALMRSGPFDFSPGFPPPPYYEGRFSSGPVWSETFAALLGRPQDAVPRQLGGRNYAFGGATTGEVNVTFNNPALRNAVDAAHAAAGTPPMNWDSLATQGGYGLQGQVRTFAALNPTGNAGTLAVLVAGGNDFVNALDPMNPQATLFNAVGNMVGAAQVLYATGVRDFLVPSLPDLSRTPRGQALPPAQAALFQNLVGAYNQILDQAFTGFAAATGANYFGLRLDTLFDNLLAQPGAYGFTNTTAPCLFTGVPCATALFADDIHPTGRAHDIIARAAYDRVVYGRDISAVPEPATLALVAGGLVVLAAGRARRGTRRAA